MKHVCSLILITLLSSVTNAQDIGGGFENESSQCISDFQRAEIKEKLHQNRIQLIKEGKLIPERSSVAVTLSLPIKSSSDFIDYNFFAISNYVDHNSNIGELTDYNCGTRSYDTESGYHHRGIDYFSWPFSWELMDDDMIEIIAAAPGTIIGKDDGNDDKSCSFNSSNWNAIYIEHADGSIAWYGHLKNGSISSKSVGETVAVGEYLGVMGSSGNSTGPHLHLEIYDSNDNLIDPYEGSCNPTTSSTWWDNQEEYYSPTVNALKTHDAAPEFGCYGEEDSHIEDEFVVGDLVYFATYFRDQQIQHVSEHRVYRPDGSLFQEWQTQSNADHYSASYWYRSFRIPTGDQAGTWSFTVEYLGNQYEHYFCVSPSKPGITFEDGQLVSSSEVGNQWFFEGEEIEGADSQTFTPIEDGAYSVNITIGDCPPSELANAYEFESQVTSSKWASNKIKLTPNPATSTFAINGLPQYSNTVDIINLSGNIVISLSSKHLHQIDISNLSKGVYIVQITTSNQTFQQTLIKH